MVLSSTERRASERTLSRKSSRGSGNTRTLLQTADVCHCSRCAGIYRFCTLYCPIPRPQAQRSEMRFFGRPFSARIHDSHKRKFRQADPGQKSVRQVALRFGANFAVKLHRQRRRLRRGGGARRSARGAKRVCRPPSSGQHDLGGGEPQAYSTPGSYLRHLPRTRFGYDHWRAGRRRTKNPRYGVRCCIKII
ncbi:hypothetical protein [Klebsiella phage vB_KshKPC-M]|nr:hypothetical protein [Klebsiella phage vB_KshKPC-M]